MWCSYIPPTIMAVIAIIVIGLKTGDVMAGFLNFGIGTIFAFLFQGSITGFADHHIFPSLKHQAIDVGKKDN